MISKRQNCIHLTFDNGNQVRLIFQSKKFVITNMDGDFLASSPLADVLADVLRDLALQVRKPLQK